MDQQKFDKVLRKSSVAEHYLPKGSPRIYHVKNSTLIVPLDQEEGQDSKSALFRLLTEIENTEGAIKYLKELTKSEIEEIW